MADQHQSDRVAPLDHHHGPIIVQSGRTDRPAATPYGFNAEILTDDSSSMIPTTPTFVTDDMKLPAGVLVEVIGDGDHEQSFLVPRFERAKKGERREIFHCYIQF